MNWNPNLILFLIFIGLPLLQWIAQKIKEQRDAAKAKESIKRRQEETLRTGRAPSDEEQAARERAAAQARLDSAQREATQQRQEQLRELRRKQMQAQAEARARARQTQPTRPRPVPTARAPQQGLPGQSPRQAPTSMPAPAQRSRSAQEAPPAQRSRQTQPAPSRPTPLERPGGTRPSDFERITKQRQAEAAKRQAMLHTQAAEGDRLGESTVRAMVAQPGRTRGGADITAPNAAQATTSGVDLLANLDADDWRRGMVLAEVLGRPIALRDDERSTWL